MCIRDSSPRLGVRCFTCTGNRKVVEEYGASRKESPALPLSLIHISEPTRLLSISYAVFCLKKKKKKLYILNYTIYYFFNDTATTEIYTRSLVGSVRCV